MTARILSAAVFLLVAIPITARAQDSRVQYTIDGSATVVQKDFGTERWSIHHRMRDGRVTGNVFFTDTRPPAFLSCDRDRIEGGDAIYECYLAPPCPVGEGPCLTRFEHLGVVTLPKDFFLPVYSTSPEPFSLESIIGIWRMDLSGKVSIATFTESGFLCGFDTIPCVQGVMTDGAPVAFFELGAGMYGRLSGDDFCATFLAATWESPDRLVARTYGGAPPADCVPPERPGYGSGQSGLLRATRIGSVPAP